MIKSRKFWFSPLFLQLCLASQTSFYVRYLDKKLCDGIEKPVLRGGKYLYRDLMDIAIFLQRIEQAMKDDDRKGDMKAKEIIKEGGIRFPNITQNDEKIMDAFNWTKEEAQEFKTKTKEIGQVWFNIVKGLDRKPLYPVDYDLESERFVNANTTT
jgi:hypothetical protein